MKFALIQPSLEDFYTTPHRVSALALHLVQNLLEEWGHTTQLFLFAKQKPKAIGLPAKLYYLKQVIEEGERGETAFFTGYKRFGPSTTEMVEVVNATSFDAILINCFAYAYADSALSLALALKKSQPDKPIAVGGGGATVNPAYFTTHGITVLAGEAETSLKLFINNRGQSKVIFGGQTITPRAVLAKVANGQYAYSFLRGCFNQCKFCSQRLTHGTGFRLAEWQQMLSCFNSLPPTLEKIYFNFEDDNLLDAKELWFNLLGYLKNRYPNAQFGAENGLNYSQLNPETLTTLTTFGFKKFNLSLAVGEGEAKAQQRFYNTKKLEQVLDNIKLLSSQAVVYFIAGLQHSNPLHSIDNLLYLYSLPCQLGISPFYAVPGLEGFTVDTLKQTDPLFFRASSLYPWTLSHTSLQLATAFRISRTLNSIKTQPNGAIMKALKTSNHLVSHRGGKTFTVTKIDNEMETYFFRQLNLLF